VTNSTEMRLSKYIILATTLLSLSGCNLFDNLSASLFQRNIDTDNLEGFSYESHETPTGSQINYELLKPADYRNDQSYPLIIILSDKPVGNHKLAELLVTDQFRDSFPAYILAPDIPEAERWNTDEYQRLKASIDLFDHFISMNDIDYVVLVGESSGAVAALEALSIDPSLYDRSVIVGPLLKDSLVKNYSQIKNSTIWIWGSSKLKHSNNLANQLAQNLRKNNDVRVTNLDKTLDQIPSEVFQNPIVWDWIVK